MALEEVGYENLSGRAVKEYGLDRLKNFKCMGIPASPITYGPKDHLGPEAGNLYTSRNGKVVPIKRPVPIPTELLKWE